MKKLFAIIAAAIIAVGVFAQSPNKMSYQAVVRNGGGVLIQSAILVFASAFEGFNKWNSSLH